MGFVLDSFANVIIGALDTIVLWICTLSVEFNLNIGESDSDFSDVFPSAAGSSVRGASGAVTAAIPQFAVAIGVLAVLIVLIITIFKIYVLMASPYSQSESPGEIALRFILGLAGVISAYPLFRYFQKGFNAAYQLFVKPYKAITDFFKTKNYISLKAAEETKESRSNDIWLGNGEGYATSKSNETNHGDSFVFGSDHLIGDPKNPGKETIIDHPFALALIELFVGIAMMIALVKLVFEIYERYVILAVLYLFSPLAFSTLVAKKGEIFRNYCWMVGSQFILMCTNLVFLGAFMAAWYNVLNKGAPSMDGKDVYFFKTSQDFVTTMLLLIGWLLVGQKMDELLRSLGLSAAQTGNGIMGAALGSIMTIRMAVGGAAAGVGTTGRALTGQTGVQRAWKAGLDGTGGGLVGKLAAATNPKGGSGGQKGPSPKGVPKAIAGNDLDDALNNAIRGRDAGDGKLEGGLAAPELGGANSAERQNFDAKKLDWQEMKGSDGSGTGIYQAYDPNSGLTYTRGTDAASNATMKTHYGGDDSTGLKNELGNINYGQGDNLLHVSKGNDVGHMPLRTSYASAPSQSGGNSVKQSMNAPQEGGGKGSSVKDAMKGGKNNS